MTKEEKRMKRVIKKYKIPTQMPEWRVDFRPMPSGIVLDLVHFLASKTDTYVYHCSRISYLIPMETIKAWAKGQNKIVSRKDGFQELKH